MAIIIVSQTSDMKVSILELALDHEKNILIYFATSTPRIFAKAEFKKLKPSAQQIASYCSTRESKRDKILNGIAREL